jgi:CubicO group peptidase (beta-lactamase class C family)
MIGGIDGGVPMELQDIVRAAIRRRGIAGVSLATLRHGVPQPPVALGMRGPHDAAPVDAQTVFEAASLTKPLAAYLALQLAGEGVLDLDRPLVELCGPYVADDARAALITARHVLSHSSGLPNLVTPDKPLKTHFAPGARFSYGGSAFGWLQLALETVAGEPLQALADQRVFVPLGMERSSLEWQPRFEANHAQGHDWEGQAVARRPLHRAHASWSLLTTAGDYARFLSAALAGAGLSPAARSQWFAPQVAASRAGHVEDLQGGPPSPDVAWGLGWGLEPAQSCCFHWGHTPGFRAFVLADLRSGDAVLWFANSERGLRLAHDVLPAVLPGPHPSVQWLEIGTD